MNDDAANPENKPFKPTPIPTLDPSLDTPGDFAMNTAHHDSSKVMTIAMCVILAVAAIGGVIAITPQVKNMASQKEEIKTLKAQLAEAGAKEEDNSQVRLQLSDVQKKMDALAQQSQNTGAVSDMQSKLDELESKFGQVVDESHRLGLAGMMSRVEALQQRPEGEAIISGLINRLAEVTDGADIGQSFDALRQTDTGLSDITQGVAPEDMKAAAMLVALSHMRHALLRGNDSFDSDLALLKKALPSDDPQLLASIDRLAPQAKFGVLSPSGLSDQFRGMAGDIASASLSGPDITVKEKLKARLANVFVVEKNGQRISGSQAQIAISAAQKKLDTGDVAGTVEILQTLNGPAAAKSQNFIDQAQATLMAQNLAGQIAASVTQNVRAGVKVLINGGMPAGVVNPYGVQGMTNSMQGAVKTLVPDAPAITPAAQPLPTAPR